MTFFERPDLSGWRVSLGAGRYPTCALRAHGLPLRAPGALRLHHDAADAAAPGVTMASRALAMRARTQRRDVARRLQVEGPQAAT